MTCGSECVVHLEGVSKRFGWRENAVWALREVRLAIGRQAFVVIMGPSGSGKSTLLNLVAGLDAPDAGEVSVAGRSLASLSERNLARLRRRTVAFVFQFFNLLPMLTAAENVAVPLRADGRKRIEIGARVTGALAAVGLSHRARHYPNELSGGEMQRVAIARALASDASVILADEPTGNLDSARSADILALLRKAVDERQRTVLLVTHDPSAARYADRLVHLRDGRIVDDETAAVPWATRSA